MSKDARERLLNINQAEQSAADFALIILSLAAESWWNEPVLKTIVHEGPNEVLQSKLACRDDAPTLKQIIQLGIHAGNLI